MPFSKKNTQHSLPHPGWVTLAAQNANCKLQIPNFFFRGPLCWEGASANPGRPHLLWRGLEPKTSQSPWGWGSDTHPQAQLQDPDHGADTSGSITRRGPSLCLPKHPGQRREGPGRSCCFRRWARRWSAARWPWRAAAVAGRPRPGAGAWPGPGRSFSGMTWRLLSVFFRGVLLVYGLVMSLMSTRVNWYVPDSPPPGVVSQEIEFIENAFRSRTQPPLKRLGNVNGKGELVLQDSHNNNNKL